MALQRLKDLVNEVTSHPQVIAEENRLKASGVTPASILSAIVTAIAQFLMGGGTGSIIQMILSLLQSLNPPAPSAPVVKTYLFLAFATVLAFASPASAAGPCGGGLLSRPLFPRLAERRAERKATRTASASAPRAASCACVATNGACACSPASANLPAANGACQAVNGVTVCPVPR